MGSVLQGLSVTFNHLMRKSKANLVFVLQTAETSNDDQSAEEAGD